MPVPSDPSSQFNVTVPLDATPNNYLSGGSGGTAPGAGLGLQSFKDVASAAQNQAQQEIASELQGQIDPLNRQSTGLQGSEDRAIAGIGSMFDNLQPVVQQGTQQVQQSYDNALQTQDRIFAAATTRLSQLKQDRAAEAQRLAQQMGGPVAIDEFTAGFDPAIQSLTNLGAGEQLHTLAYAQAGVQAANAFSGQVFPVMRTEQIAQARNMFEDQIRDLRGKIQDLNAQKPGLTNTRMHELMKDKLDYNLQVAQTKLDQLNKTRDWNLDKKRLKLDAQTAHTDSKIKGQQLALDRRTANQQWKGLVMNYNLDKVKVRNDWRVALKQIGLDSKKYNLDKLIASRDWKATLRTMGLDEKKTNMAIDQFDKTYGLQKRQTAVEERQIGLEEGKAVGEVGGKPTVEAKQTAADIAAQKRDDARAMAQLDISSRELELRKDELRANTKLQNRKYDTEVRAQAAEYLDAALNPTPGKSITTSEIVPVTSIQAIKGGSDIYYDPSSPTKYSRVVKVTRAAPDARITEPNDLVDYLVSHGVGEAQAVGMVKRRLHIPNWDYGEELNKKQKAKVAIQAKARGATSDFGKPKKVKLPIKGIQGPATPSSAAKKSAANAQAKTGRGKHGWSRYQDYLNMPGDLGVPGG